MAERPILFSGPMVRAILDGRKTQTRRAVKPQPVQGSVFCDSDSRIQPGDQLWVREAWRPFTWTENGGPWVFQYKSDRATMVERDIKPDKVSDYEDWNLRVWQQASDECVSAGFETGGDDHFIRDPNSGEAPGWRSSIYMPRWASRLTLNVTAVRAERLQEISREDAIGEGAFLADESEKQQAARVAIFEGQESVGPVGYFREVWDTINGRTQPWQSNPWVWVYEFEVAE